MQNQKRRDESTLCNGFQDGLKPLEPLDLNKIKTFSDLTDAMSKTAFQGRRLGEAVDVLVEMIKDPECFVVMTLSGAMTIAKMGLLISEMIDRRMINAIVSTGALMAHGFIESSGLYHFKYENNMSDKELYLKGYDRVYDTIELEQNLDDAETIINDILTEWPENEILCSYKLNQILGKYLVEKTEGRGPLKSAYEQNIPVFIPAFTDSEFGLNFGLFNRLNKQEGKDELFFNSFIDLEYYTKMIIEQKTLGIFTVGGGVPRNWAQQVGPYLDIIEKRGFEKHAFKRFKYGVRICPEPVHWGGLSGCTYSEGVTWGKFVPEAEGGRTAEVLVDATVVWPLLMKSVIEKIDNKKS